MRASIASLLLLCGCVAPQPAPQRAPASRDGTDVTRAVAATIDVADADPASAPPRPRDLSEEDRARVRQLLAEAEQALAEDRLFVPAENSAISRYDKILAIDPGNLDAIRGLEKIVERYLELALEAADRRQFERARAMLEQAALADPRHPGIEPTAERIRLLSSAKRTVIRLDGAELSSRSAALVARLHDAGARIRTDGCRALISARNDAEGRWIYQQLSGAPGDARIRAEMQIAWPPNIEILCFPDAADS
ncbi:MAG: hypothetical protein R3E86_19385 [Pseudomonadales bacterium]